MIEIFTDASTIIPLGISGWAVLIRYPNGTITELKGTEICGRISRMELLAVVKALSNVKECSKITVYTDSQYVMRGSSQFKKADNNYDLWEQLNRLKADRYVSFVWVRSHSGHPDNEWVDRMARKAARDRVRRMYV